MKQTSPTPFRFRSRLWVAVLAAVLIFASCRKEEYTTPLPQVNTEDIVILFDNDVHCAIDGYSKMASLKKTVLEQTGNVCVVSCGDFVQGESYGILSQGEYPIELMNAVGYDFVTLGNHEFDYGIGRLIELTRKLDAEVLCANFVRISDQQPLFTLSATKVFESGTVAFIGVATPQTITSSTPTFFQDEEGNFKYSFCESKLVEIVQQEVNRQRSAGADYVVVLSHLGDIPGGFTSQQLISQTSGIDVLLDGHAHSLIPCDSVLNKAGKYVKRSSTGTKFANIGKVVITSQGRVTTELVDTKNISNDPVLEIMVSHIKQKLNSILSKVVGSSSVTLSINDANGNRIVRNRESSIGDFAADAFRDYFGSDIGWVNGGNLRADIKEGAVTFGDILAVSPFGNQVLYGHVTGQLLLDNLEMSYRLTPVENGGFAQLSGIRCEIDTAIATSVVLDANGILQSVGERRRVKNVEVLNRATGQYEPINPAKDYTIAAVIYVLQQKGDGQNFDGIRLINDRPILSDAEILVRYIKQTLGGTIGSTYASTQGRITVR